MPKNTKTAVHTATVATAQNVQANASKTTYTEYVERLQALATARKAHCNNPTKMNVKAIARAERNLAKAETAVLAGGIITAENIEQKARCIALKALSTVYQKSGQPFICKLRANLIGDIVENHRTGKPLSDGYDIVQECATYLIPHIGRGLNDTADPTATTDGENDTPPTILRKAFHAVNAYIMGERQREYKRTFLDDIDDNGNVIVYELPKEWDMPTAEDYAKVIAIINALNLSQKEKQYLHYRLRGYGLDVIAQKMGISKSTAQTYGKRVQAKADSIGLSPRPSKSV